jgi:hypothetical protein
LIVKKGLSWYFTLIISREQQNGQNPSMVTRARQTLDKPRHPKKSMNKGDLYFAACNRCVFLKTIIQMTPVRIQKINRATLGEKEKSAEEISAKIPKKYNG